ncbi:MAG TPA: hypothetical protein VHA71_00500 [Rhodanobacteraceae bacterium]|jgi:hypothetical protein|nr:hypothetical protein [Rhodanobacteraceae bacterium]
MKRMSALIILVFLSCFSLTCWASGTACGVPSGIPASDLLLFGEMHGSSEAPALVGGIVCARAGQQPLALGLELPPDEQAPIDRYLVSDGDIEAKQRLLSGDFWRSDKDGRASAAMAALLESVRRFRHEGLPVTVFTFSDILPAKTYDASIAQAIRDFRTKHPRMAIIALMGNVHASPMPFRVEGHDLLTAAYLLRDLHPTSVLLAYQSGTIWACMPGCGVHKVASEWGNARKPGLHEGSPMGGYSTSYVLPRITASPPAVDNSAKSGEANIIPPSDASRAGRHWPCRCRP